MSKKKYKTEKEKHPLYCSWCSMRKNSVKFPMCTTWYEDFYTFVRDMGQRPSKNHCLRRIDTTLGYNKANCEWRVKTPSSDKAKYQRMWRNSNPDKAKNNELKARYGISLQEYNRIAEYQDHCCFICKQQEKYSGSLAVDHCHHSGAIRGLLCSQCNRALGLFTDSIATIEQALSYLKISEINKM